MNALLIVAVALGTAFLAARASRRRSLTPADFVIGLFAGLASVGLGSYVGIESLGVQLFIGCALALGLESLPQRGVLR